MEAKFTKGEWLRMSQGAIYDALVNRWFYTMLDKEGKILLRVYGQTVEEAEANARLIAAAPAMFEALRSIVEYWNTPQSESMVKHIEHSLAAAEAAIKKATE